MGRTVVIGLDSVDWKFLERAIEQGRAPNLKSIYESGFHGDLRSIDPPLSVPAWLCFSTGKRPDKLDLYNFRVWEPGTYNLNNVAGFEEYQEQVFWKDLDDVGIVGVPSIYPSSSVDLDGFIFSGPFAPEDASPEDFEREVEDFGYSSSVPNFWKFEECIEHLEMEGDFISEVLERRDPGFFIAVTSVTDRVQHAYCNDEKKMMELYGEADDFVGKVLEHLDDEDNVFVVSDHGYSEIRKVFYVNKWLQEQGFLEFNETGSSFSSGLKENLRYGLKKTGKKVLGRLGLLEFAMDHTPEPVREGIRSKENVWNKVDWKNTEAFATGGYVGQVFINTEDYPDGEVSGDEYEEVREEIIEKLEELEDPETGEKVVDQVWRKEEIYREEIADRAPDILFYPKDMAYKVNDGFHGRVFDESVPNGSHGLNGVVLGRGPDIRNGEVDMHLTDVAPTLLHLMEEGVPEDMDGEVRGEIFKEGSEPEGRKVRKVSEELEDLDF
jgi:predicted AlkP superfamily phosphohydrolase/phosphomutase